MAIGERENKLSKSGMNSVDGVVTEAIYYPYHNILIRMIRKIWCNFNLPGFQIWFGEWWKEIEQYEAVIAIAYKSTYRLFQILRKRYPAVRRIIYWWDPAIKTILPDKVKSEVCEKWSFSKNDSLNFNLKYNPTFLPVDSKIYENIMEPDKMLYDIMFVGSVGKIYYNRVQILSDFYSICEKKGLSTYIKVLYHSRGKNRPFELKSAIAENEYYEIVKKSRAILDIVEPDNKWMTLRPLEALYFHKKLISNNEELVNEPLYHPDNVFIVGKDDINNLPEFLNKPIKQLEEAVYQHYAFKAWLERFGLDITGNRIGEEI